MGLRTVLGLKRKKPVPPARYRYPDRSPEARASAHILPARPTFTDYIHRRINDREPNTPWMSKVGMTDFAANLGLRTPKTLALLADVADFDPDVLPDRFVVKPSEWWSTRGVMLLRKVDGGLYDLMRRDVVSIETIKVEQAAHQQAYIDHQPGSRPTIVIEELVEDERGPDTIPFDYKFYTFNGNVRFIVQVDRNSKPPKIAFYRNNFIPIVFNKYMEGKLDTSQAQHGAHRKPRCWSELLSAASLASKKIGSPFISVDTYASVNGAVIGELTPTPGGPYYGMWRFQPWFDQKLGDEWTKVTKKLAPKHTDE